jgi:hypothetical protein
MNFYVLPGAELTITTRFDKNGAGDFKMYVATGAKVTFENGLNSSIKLYNRGDIVVKGEGQSGAYGTGVIYNQGTMTFEGTSTDYFGSIKPYGGTVSGALVIENNNSQVINEGTLISKGLRVEGTGHFKNVSGGQVTINGYTIVNSNQCSWINDGEYNTTNYYYTAGSQDVINNCHLNVTELFYMNLGDTGVNGFQMDGGSSVITQNYWADGPGFIYMGSKSVFKVNETATMDHTKANYGIYGEGAEYAVFQAKDITTTNPAQAYDVTYSGTLAVVAETHFDSANNYSSKSGEYPIIDFKNGCTKGNLYIGGAMPEIRISASTCNPGFPTGYSDEGKLEKEPSGTSSSSSEQQWEIKTVIDHKRVFCEDLGSSSNRKDFDYNDVVFDAKIISSYFEDRTYEGTILKNTSAPYGHNYYAEITVLAAGGELELTVGDQQVNELFAKPLNMIINTVSEKDDDEFAASHNSFDDPFTPQTFTYNFASEEEATINNIPVMAKHGVSVIYLKSKKGEAPQKICVPIRPNTRWAYERVDIATAYGNFGAWVGHVEAFQSVDDVWKDNYTEGNLYPNRWPVTDMTGTTSSEFKQYKAGGSTTFTFDPVPSGNGIVWSTESSDGQALSNQAITIASSYFSNAVKGTVVRLYGVDEGDATITVMAGNVALGATTRATGMLYKYTLNTAQAEAAEANGLAITGSNFKLHYVTVEAPEEDVIEYVEPTFGANDFNGKGNLVSGISQQALTSTGITVAASNFTKAGAGTEVYVYGSGDASTVSVSVDGSNLTSRATRGTIYRPKDKKIVKFTMNADQAKKAQTEGVKITGSDFTLHAVSVKIVEEQVTPTPNPGTGETIFSGTLDVGDWTVDKKIVSDQTTATTIFNNLKVGSVITFTITAKSDKNYFMLQMGNNQTQLYKVDFSNDDNYKGYQAGDQVTVTITLTREQLTAWAEFITKWWSGSLLSCQGGGAILNSITVTY